MPIGPYPDFAACVSAQKRRGKSDVSAHKICGYLEQRVKHKNMSTSEFEESLTLFERLYPDDDGFAVDAAILKAEHP